MLNMQEHFLGLLNESIKDSRILFRIGDQERLVGNQTEKEDGSAEVTVRVNNPLFFNRVMGSGNLGMGEAYMAQEFEIEKGNLQDFLTILLRNRLDKKIKMRPFVLARILLLRFMNALRGRGKNVRRHYDIGDDLFEAYLDSTLTYSCGYVDNPTDDLETLQFNKLERICRKLRLEAGQRLLDIGCGYGGLLIHAARHYDVHGVGVTVSRHQFERGKVLITEKGLSDRIQIELMDFSRISGQYDKVVSVGMLEHVPRAQYSAYFKKIARVLSPQGMGLVHCVGANASKNTHDPFIQKYIFPNSGQPLLSEIAAQLERNALAILDVENFIRHYGYTARCWLDRFKENRPRLDPSKYDGAFLRVWEYFLCCCIAAAFASDSALYQVLFIKDYAADLPLHRI